MTDDARFSGTLSPASHVHSGEVRAGALQD